MALYQNLVIAYSKAIYLDGTKTFSQIKPEYAEPVKQYAAANYSQNQIYTAYTSGRISLEEYNETLAYAA